MKSKQDKDMKLMEKEMRKTISKKYTPSIWSRFKDAMGSIYIASVVVIFLLTSLFIVIILIENPISLTIICSTILILILICLNLNSRALIRNLDEVSKE